MLQYGKASSLNTRYYLIQKHVDIEAFVPSIYDKNVSIIYPSSNTIKTVQLLSNKAYSTGNNIEYQLNITNICTFNRILDTNNNTKYSDSNISERSFDKIDDKIISNTAYDEKQGIDDDVKQHITHTLPHSIHLSLICIQHSMLLILALNINK